MRTALILALVMALAVSAAIAAGGRTGEEVFNEYCIACHESGMMDAPIYHSGDFAARIKEKGFDTLLENAMKGLGDMPAKGECGDCTKEEIKAAIEFMAK